MTIDFSDLTPVIYTDDNRFQFLYERVDLKDGFCLTGKNRLFEDVLEFTVNGEELCCKRTIKNISGGKINLKELSVSCDFSLGGKPFSDYYYTTENLRLFNNYTIPVDFDRLSKKSFSGAREIDANAKYVDNGAISSRINSSPYMPFPAILISNYDGKDGVVHGSLSQDYFYHNYELSHINGKIRFDIFSSQKSVKYRVFKPNEKLVDKWYLGTVDNAADFNSIFDGYTKKLKKVLKNSRGKLSTNRHTLVWDSWNDGIFRDVSEEKLLAEASAAKKYFHNLEWFQLDDGYSAMCNPDVDLDAHGLGVIYEGEEGIDYDKFPSGLKSYTDKIKAMGLKPAIWIGGLCPVCSKIYKERKDWFIDFTYRTDFSQPLDVSNKFAREYMIRAITKYIKDYGFEGVKHDFWSYAFEESHDNFIDCRKNGYEYRSWWQKEFTRLLQKYGYVGTACDLSLGNPFIGKYFNNYRFGLDVCSGQWEKLLVTMFWGVGCLGTHTGDLFIPNCDSIGILPSLSDTDFIFWINHAIITRTIVEISGRYSRVKEDNNRLKILQKATACLNNGEKVYFAKFDYRDFNNLPRVYYLNSLYFERGSAGKSTAKTVAVFNAEEREQEISFSLKDIRAEFDKAIITDVWTGESEVISGELKIKLCPHESRLFTVCDFNLPGILDANVEVLKPRRNKFGLHFAVNYSFDAELTVNFDVKSVLLSGREIYFKQEKNRLYFKTEPSSKISLIFQ